MAQSSVQRLLPVTSQDVNRVQAVCADAESRPQLVFTENKINTYEIMVTALYRIYDA